MRCVPSTRERGRGVPRPPGGAAGGSVGEWVARRAEGGGGVSASSHPARLFPQPHAGPSPLLGKRYNFSGPGVGAAPWSCVSCRPPSPLRAQPAGTRTPGTGGRLGPKPSRFGNHRVTPLAFLTLVRLGGKEGAGTALCWGAPIPVLCPGTVPVPRRGAGHPPRLQQPLRGRGSRAAPGPLEATLAFEGRCTTHRGNRLATGLENTRVLGRAEQESAL